MTRVAIVEGDGIGHEVIPVARDVLALLHSEFDYFPVDVGYSRWEVTGYPVRSFRVFRVPSRHSRFRSTRPNKNMPNNPRGIVYNNVGDDAQWPPT